jgi:rhodanese-related sulfurtransferase
VVSPATSPVRHDGIDAMLADARARLDRIDVETAYREALEGAFLVDIRPAAQRASEGEVSPALHPFVIERNVLEWRFDPRSEACLPEATYDARILVLCQEGYTSSLAADALRSLGLDATDVVGGFRAWREAHLPTACPRGGS